MSTAVDPGRPMVVDVWSDVVCPWCYLGKRRLEVAVAELGLGDDIEVRWRAFELDPWAPDEPRPYRQVLERKYGPGAFEALTGRLVPLGRDAGIDYRFDRVRRVSSRTAHRLAAWAAATAGNIAAGRLHDRLFEAYFTDGADIGDHGVLAASAADAGLDGVEARKVVDSDRYLGEVRADEEEARRLELTGVPAFVVGGRLLIPGAQDPETMRLILRRAYDRGLR